MFLWIKSTLSDYHSEMNYDLFLRWLKEIVFPKIKEIGKNAVLVLDRATYHNFKTENSRRPILSWEKDNLSDAIRRWGGPLNETGQFYGTR